MACTAPAARHQPGAHEPGTGVLNATALVAVIGEGRTTVGGPEAPCKHHYAAAAGTETIGDDHSNRERRVMHEW